MHSPEIRKVIRKIGIAGTLGTAVAFASAGCGEQPKTPTQFSGWSVTFNTQELPYDAQNPDKNVTCYATEIGWQKDPNGNKLLVLSGSSGFPNKINPDTGMPYANGPECYFGNDQPVNSVDNNPGDVAQAVDGLETVPMIYPKTFNEQAPYNKFEPLRNLAENKNMFPFGIVANRRVFAISNYDANALNNINLPTYPDNQVHS